LRFIEFIVTAPDLVINRTLSKKICARWSTGGGQIIYQSAIIDSLNKVPPSGRHFYLDSVGTLDKNHHKVNNMNQYDVGLLTENLLLSALFGLGVLIIVTLFCSTMLIRINVKFSTFCHSTAKHSSLSLNLHFIAAILKICLVQIVAILFWTMAVYWVGLADNLRLAFMFVGSCFTTLGIISDIFPAGWQSVAFYIAFSGLFSFALATSVMISLLTDIVKALPKPFIQQSSGN
jgi:hypothetical protein